MNLLKLQVSQLANGRCFCSTVGFWLEIEEPDERVQCTYIIDLHYCGYRSNT